MIYSSVVNLLHNVRAMLMPFVCAYCRKFLSERVLLCNDCQARIIPIVSKSIAVTSSCSVTVFALSDYKDPLKKLILAKSWSDILASQYMGQLLSESRQIQELDCDVIVPIPLHWTRYAWRGYNQAHEVAWQVHKKKKVPLRHLLKRVKKTQFQSRIASHMRGENLKEAFELNGVFLDEYAGKHILLVDDLMTTGATIRSAVKVLLALKARKVTVAVVCRVI
jgi:ComF family protein